MQTPKDLDVGDLRETLNRRVSVEFDTDDGRKFYDGTITNVRTLNNGRRRSGLSSSEFQHFIEFDDGDERWIDIPKLISIGGFVWLTKKDQRKETDKTKATTPVAVSSSPSPDKDNESKHDESKPVAVKSEDLVDLISISSSNKSDEDYGSMAVATPDKPTSNYKKPAPDVPSSSIRSRAAAITPDKAVSNREAPAPDIPSSNIRARAIRTVLNDMQEDVTVKIEKNASKLSEDERKKRKASIDSWIKANTDPRTKKGRHVFRRGCHAHCLTQLLGGIGTHEFPIVKNPPKINGKQNPFIKTNEFYVAGAESFNPFGPRFPGDKGLVDRNAFGRVEGFDQEEFHFFVQCAKHPHNRHWHGKDAVDGRMYVGVYRRVKDEDGEDEVVTPVPFDSVDLDMTNRLAISEFYAERYDKLIGTDWRDRPKFKEFRKQAKACVGEDEWSKLTFKQMDTRTIYQKLMKEKYEMNIIPVEFVRYDEELYKALVDSDAMTTRKGRRGRVALTPDALHQYY